MADFHGSSGNDNLVGTNSDDLFRMGQGGNDTVAGKDGNDIFDFDDAWSIDDVVRGGTGLDTVKLSNGGNNLVIGSHALKDLERIELADNGDYTITFQNAGRIGDHVTMDGSALSSNHFLTVDAGNEKTRSVTLIGGDDSDHLTGGQADDTLRGGLGRDFLDGEGGSDTMSYTNVAQSTGINCDHVTFGVANDQFDFPFAVSGVDAVIHSKLNGQTASQFDANMETKVGSDKLGAHHAVVFDVKFGDWANHRFLIVDANGSAGYQAGADYVFDMLGDHIKEIDSSNFAG